MLLLNMVGYVLLDMDHLRVGPCFLAELDIDLECVCFKLYLYILKNKMIEIYISMFFISLLNFIPGNKRFLEKKNISIENDGNKSSHESKLVCNYPLTFLL